MLQMGDHPGGYYCKYGTRSVKVKSPFQLERFRPGALHERLGS